MEAFERDVLPRRVRSGQVTVLHVRPEEYRPGHLPGARLEGRDRKARGFALAVGEAS